jgi:hypothetical protein
MFDMSWDLDPSKSAARQIECDLVKHICNSTYYRWLLQQYLEFDEPVLIASHVVQPIRRNRFRQPGDLDILICPVRSPEQAIAIECKRVPVFARDNVRKKRYRLIDRGGRYQYRALEEGTEQIQSLYRLRFHRTYHMVIIATDGGDRWGYPPFFRHATQEVHRSIDDLRQPPNIPSGVGLITMEIVQTMGEPIQSAGGVLCQLARPARCRIQDKRITANVARLLDEPLAYLECVRACLEYEGKNDCPTLHYLSNI